MSLIAVADIYGLSGRRPELLRLLADAQREAAGGAKILTTERAAQGCPASQSSSICRVKRMCLPRRRHGSRPARTAS